MQQIWRMPLNSQRVPDFKKDKDNPSLFIRDKANLARKFCFGNSWVGIGWGVPSLQSDLENPKEYLAALAAMTDVPPNFNKRDAELSCKALVGEVKDGDFVWCRTKSDNSYRLGRIVGPWRYFCSGEFRDFDLHQVRRCRWTPPILADDVPGPIKNSFAGPGMAISLMSAEKEAALLGSCLLWKDLM